MHAIVANLDSKGAVVVPAKLRRLLGLAPGALVLMEVRDGSLVLKPAVAVPTERYDAERRAEFALNNASDDDEYTRAVEQVRAMGLDPAKIRHERPRPGPG